jgi:hypothetical protein
MKTGTNGSVTIMIAAETASIGMIQATTATGTSPASTSWGRNRPK